jgi:hypothetical protein
LFALWEKELALISGKSKLAEHIRYALERRASFPALRHGGHPQQSRRSQ